MTKTSMTETTMTTKTVTMTTTMNDVNDDVNERGRFNNQLARERNDKRGIDMTREGCQARRFATATAMTMATTMQR